jgi:hypothetical protein
LWVTALWLTALLGACSSGPGAVTAESPAPGPQPGTLSLSLGGGAASGYEHVWVTVSAAALHADADRAWSEADSSWQVFRLPAPLTLDLATTTNGAVLSLFDAQPVAAGTYGQLRLFVLAHDAPLAESARQRGLAYNAQADFTDADGAPRSVPIELADTALGLRLPGRIRVDADQATVGALQWDADTTAVRFAGDAGAERLTLRPQLRAYDLAYTGAILGVLDKSLFCAAGVRASNCIYDVVAAALRPAADGALERSVRATKVDVSQPQAQFALYPLPVLAEGETFDVVIRGRNMRTIIVRAVPAPARDFLNLQPTLLAADARDPKNPVPLQPKLSAGDGSVDLSAPLSVRSAQLVFAQTLPGAGEVPLEIAAANTDPFTGRLVRPVPLPAEALSVATYAANAPLGFDDVVPQEGNGGYKVLSLGTSYEDASAFGTLNVSSGTATSFAAPEPTAKSGLATATLTINLTGGSQQQYDAAQLVIADVGGIVHTQDVAALIGVAGAQASVTLPAGASAAALGGTAIYSVSVRLWKRAEEDSTLRWVRGAAVDLRSGSSTAVTIALP